MPNELSYEVSLERSNQIRADLPQHPEKYTMLTGDRPTGRLHLGHYFGTLKSRVELQELGVHTNVLIADYQVITDRDSTDNIQDNVYNMVIDYLACGLDPDKTMIYTHSAVPACNQLMLPFLSLVSEALLQRNPTVKAEMEASGHELTGLLLTYPVHQACDILFTKGNVVPVGRDQLPHIELTRTIARKFNNRYGNVFPEVDALLSDTPLLPGLDGRKMSKSYGNAINISMTAEETAKRIKKSQTDGERMITFDPEARPGVSGLLSTAAICTGRSEVEIAEEIGMKSEFRNIAWDGIFASLESGQANVIASCVTITDKRKKAYVFSDPYYEVHQAVVVAKDSAIKKPEDLKGKKVGVQIGTTAIEALRKMNVDIDLRTYDEVGLVFEDMRNGRLDVVVCDDPVARYYASRKEGYKDLMKVAFLTEDVEYIGFVFSKDNAELAAQVNKGLKAIRENGKEKAIRNKWLGE